LREKFGFSDDESEEEDIMPRHQKQAVHSS